MTKGSGTRSGLLWEVERLLTECNHLAETSYTDYGLPQILLMENVPQVHSKANMPDFEQWIAFLHKMGYENYWQDMNARDYGVAQNRNRCFMVSILGNRTFTFPNKIELKKRMKDYLDDEVEDKYYITSVKAQKLIETLILDGKIPTDRQAGIDLCSQHAKLVELPNTIKARYDSGIINHKYDNTGVVETQAVILRGMGSKRRKAKADLNVDEAAPCLVRDYKGLNNWGSNGVLNCQKIQQKYSEGKK